MTYFTWHTICILDTSIASLIASLRPHGISSPTQQQELARAAKRGDSAAREKLIVGSTALVVKLMSPWLGAAATFGMQASDLLTIALYGPDGDGKSGAVRAIDKYDPDRGTRLSTYIGYWVWHAIDTAFRRATIVATPSTRPRRHRPEITRCPSDDAPEIGETPSTEEEIDVSDAFAAVWPALEQLSHAHQRVVKLLYSRRSPTRAQVAAELGIERKEVRRLEKEALLHVREHLLDSGIESPF